MSKSFEVDAYGSINLYEAAEEQLKDAVVEAAEDLLTAICAAGGITCDDETNEALNVLIEAVNNLCPDEPLTPKKLV